MLVIFDIDGTICDTQEIEGRCFISAVKDIIGVSLKSADWTTFSEPTSMGITRELLEDIPGRSHKSQQIKNRFIELLEQEQPQFPGDFTPLQGAKKFIQYLVNSPNHSVAFATGGFDTEAEFKLRCCGFSIADFPHATSSDTPARKDIIALAAERAGIALDSTVYFGDATWDLAVSRELGIPFVGIGRKITKLQELGAQSAFRDFSAPEAILAHLSNLK